MEQNKVSSIMIPESEWLSIKNLIKKLELAVLKNTEACFGSKWLEEEDARKILKVSEKTWNEYLEKGIIPFSQYEGKIYVKKDDIKAFVIAEYIVPLK